MMAQGEYQQREVDRLKAENAQLRETLATLRSDLARTRTLIREEAKCSRP
jgi:cell division protein FtsB